MRLRDRIGPIVVFLGLLAGLWLAAITKNCTDTSQESAFEGEQ